MNLMEMTPQALWQILILLYSDPRFKKGLYSLGGCLILHYMVWKTWPRWMARRKVKARRRLAESRKKTVKDISQQAQNVDAIVSMSVPDLVQSIKTGQYTAEEVLLAVTRKALIVNEKINAITEPLLEAQAEARRLDQQLEKKGILHGIPVSFKENIAIAGHDSNAGMEINVNKIIQEDAVIVKVLRKHGAIPFARTNLPQTMISYCSSNPIYGETVNPLDKTRSPGGSSSGEGALVGAGGSLLGIGTDIGGSVRIPAAFCGVYGLKTTVGRLSKKGVYQIENGRVVLESSLGPMARDFNSLLTITRAIFSEEMFRMDPHLPSVPFNEQEYAENKPLRIGYYTYDGNLQCQPAVVRAVLMAKRALEKAGHELVPIDFPKVFSPGYNHGFAFYSIVFADKGNKLRTLLSNDMLAETTRFLTTVTKIPGWFLTLAASLCYLMKSPLQGNTINGVKGFKSVTDYFDHVTKLKQWRENFTKHWTDLKIDAMICPVHPSVAVKKDLANSLNSCGVYCQLYNCVNYPSGTLPITHVTENDVDEALQTFKPENRTEKLLLENVKGSEGLPVAVQCVALPFKEEICLRVMRDLKTLIHNK